MHVHFRDGEQDYKETISGGLKKAATHRIVAIGDMPNTKPPILRKENVRERLELAAKEKSSVKYFLWVGLTPEKNQIKEAIGLEKEIPQVIGFKLYAGPTTGELAVTDKKEQEKIYRILSGLGYKGVLAVHCEKKKELRPELWNVEKPWTHGKARPLKAEIRAVKEQIELVEKTNFKGNLHICHVSCRKTLKMVRKARLKGLNVTCEVTPHHVLLTEKQMREKQGSRFKVNPPLRKKKIVKKLRKFLLSLVKKGVTWIWIATDHAPHTLEEKLSSNPPSGIADYSLYDRLLNWLKEKGLSVSEIERLTFYNAVKSFGKKFKNITPR